MLLHLSPFLFVSTLAKRIPQEEKTGALWNAVNWKWTSTWLWSHAYIWCRSYKNQTAASGNDLTGGLPQGKRPFSSRARVPGGDHQRAKATRLLLVSLKSAYGADGRFGGMSRPLLNHTWWRASTTQTPVHPTTARLIFLIALQQHPESQRKSEKANSKLPCFTKSHSKRETRLEAKRGCRIEIENRR